jgi:hypothetical protein
MDACGAVSAGCLYVGLKVVLMVAGMGVPCRKILSGLVAGGLLKGDLQEMIEAEVGGLFMPHGEL